MNASLLPSSVTRQRGLTLIELLVAMTIGLVVTLAVTSIVTVGEAHKRTTTSNNDMGQSGAFAAYSLDRTLRSAGSGFAQAWNLGVFGCKLGASRVISGAATTILPRTAAFPAPFAGFLGSAFGDLRMAPLLIGKSQSASGSDVLMVMSGNAAAGDVPRRVLSPGGVLAASSLRVDNTVGLKNGDLGLLSQEGATDCVIEQVNVTDATAFAASGNEELPLGSTYYAATTGYTAMRASGTAYYSPLGNVAANNVQLQLIGVGDNRTLFSYDLLRSADPGTDAAAMQALADGVAGLHALYGVDTDNNGTADTWVDPGATGYTIATLMATPATTRKILAVRVALVMRSSEYSKDLVSPTTLTLFGNLATALQRTVTLSTDDQHYRYRVVDTTIPLRNMLLLPTS